MRSSPPKIERQARRLCRLLVGCALTAFSTANAWADQPGETLQAQQQHVVLDRPTLADPNATARLNPTGRAVTLTVPAKDGAIYLGDLVITIGTDDKVEFAAQRLLDLLINVLDPSVLKTLQASFAGKTTLTMADFAATGIELHYDPQQLAVILTIAAERRATQTLMVSPLDRARLGDFIKPAAFSAYLNVRGNVDYLSDGPDTGVQSPVMFLDGAARVLGTVAESEAIWQPGSDGVDFQRLGSRLVYDDQDHLMRWTLGDLQPTARGFQASPEISGLSVFRSYSVLQPQQIVRPRGDRSFQLDRPSTVEVQINGQTVRRLQLSPGTYDLRNFPFTQGANDIKLSVVDDTGRTQVLRFNIFLDQSQLARGLSEFGFYAGVLSPLQSHGPHYTNDFAVSGYFRHGFTDSLTLGVNFQAGPGSRMGGVEAVLGTAVGTFATTVSASDIASFGSGYATQVTFQRLIQRGGGRSDSLSLFFEGRSRNFGPMGTLTPSNPFKWETGGGYSHAFSDYFYGGVDGRYSSGRDTQRDLYTLRGTLGWRVNDRISATSDIRWERDNVRSGVGALLSLTVRFGRFANARADYDTRDQRARLSYNVIHGQGVGSYNLAGDIERSKFGSGINATGTYFANRAELGLSHYGTFQNDFGASTGQRTSFRFASSLAVADGTASIGRPIYDSFAIVRGHESLKGASIMVDPTVFGYTAATGMLGTAVQPSLSSYAERTLTVDAPNAPAGIDLGQGAYRLYPPYRSGYSLRVGSDYSVTALGRFLDASGEPVALVTGSATEMAHPEREPVTVFTNKDGRFGLTGLAPGKWRVEMHDAEKSRFMINIPKGTEGIVRTGDMKPSQDGE
jgi:outer membrane usher protein